MGPTLAREFRLVPSTLYVLWACAPACERSTTEVDRKAAMAVPSVVETTPVAATREQPLPTVDAASKVRSSTPEQTARHQSFIARHQDLVRRLAEITSSKATAASSTLGQFDFVRLPSPALDVPPQADLLDVIVEGTGSLRVSARPLTGASSIVVNDLQGSSASLEPQPGLSMSSACPSTISDNPEAVDLSVRFQGVWLVATFRDPSVCADSDREFLATRVQRAKDAISRYEAPLFEYLKRLADDCPPSRGRLALDPSPLEDLPGFERVDATCRAVDGQSLVMWPQESSVEEPPVARVQHGGASPVGGYHPSPGLTLSLWRFDDGAEAIHADWVQPDGSEVKAEVVLALR